MSILKFQNHAENRHVDLYGVFENLCHNHGVMPDDLHFCVRAVRSGLILYVIYCTCQERIYTLKCTQCERAWTRKAKKDDALDWISSNDLFCTNYQEPRRTVGRRILPIRAQMTMTSYEPVKKTLQLTGT